MTDISSPTAPYMMLHLGSEGCGKPAILLTEYPPIGSVVQSRIVRMLDGSPVKYGSKAVCGSCGHALVSLQREAIRHSDGREVQYTPD